MPGEVYAITIQLFPIANLFCRGHRLRLDISSSNFPVSTSTRILASRKARGSSRASPATGVFAEAARPSHILLPIIPSVGEHLVMYAPRRMFPYDVVPAEPASG